MEKNIEILKDQFNKIKNMELTKSLRKGSTGIGYTFETLIGKKEDSNYLPDFHGIEIKTKLGYSKSPLTLFTLVPIKDNDHSISFILNKFGYPSKNSAFKCFRGNIFCNFNNLIANKYIFKIKVNEESDKLELIIYDKSFNIIDNSIYWNLKQIKERLITKLSYLAIIKGYPYKKNNAVYYKYTNLSIYKLKDFKMFLKLIKEDKITIVFNIGVHTSKEKYGQISDRGTAFRLNINYIDELFSKIDN